MLDAGGHSGLVGLFGSDTVFWGLIWPVCGFDYHMLHLQFGLSIEHFLLFILFIAPAQSLRCFGIVCLSCLVTHTSLIRYG